MNNLNYLMDHIVYKIFRTISNTLSKIMKQLHQKLWNYLEVLKEKTTKEKNGECASQIEINEVVLVHCSIVNNRYQHDWRVWCTFVPSKSFCQLMNISRTCHIYSKNIPFRILIPLTKVYWSKFYAPRDRRQDRFGFGC